MAEQVETIEEPIEAVEEVTEEQPIETSEEEGAADPVEEVQEVESEEEEVVVSIEGESLTPIEDEGKDAPDWVRELRTSHKEQGKELKELKKKYEDATRVIAPAVQAVGKEPTLESSDFDSDKYATELRAWYQRKNSADIVVAQQNEANKKVQDAWNSKMESYEQAKSNLKVKDFDEAELVVNEKLSQLQQSIIVSGAENPALTMYAIGKNAARAKELSEITDPVKFAFAVSKLETKLTVGKRKAATSPEKVLKGNSSISGTVDNELKRLETEADKSGNRTKIVAYKRKMRDRKNK